MDLLSMTNKVQIWGVICHEKHRICTISQIVPARPQ